MVQPQNPKSLQGQPSDVTAVDTNEPASAGMTVEAQLQSKDQLMQDPTMGSSGGQDPSNSSST